jgi:hypothetical protein
VKNFNEVVEKFDKLFDEVDEADYNWRCRFTWILILCLYDAEKKPDAFKVLDRLWETTKKKGPCNFQDHLFRMRIHYGGENAAMLGACQKEAEGAGKDDEKGWKLLFVL